jgi:predicted enzyme related to lactoylglutathione lyase
LTQPATPALIEFPADDPERALRFWSGVLGVGLDARDPGEGEGWQTHGTGTDVGVHARGRGPGDSFSLPYFEVGDLPAALNRVAQLGGTIVHPGERWAICRDSEGSPFALSHAAPGD